MRSRRLTPLLLLGFAFCEGSTEVSESDLFCEEAAANLRLCCGFTPVGLDCEDQPVGCGSPPPGAESRCIGSQPCFALQRSGYCNYAQARYGDPPLPNLPPEPELCR